MAVTITAADGCQPDATTLPAGALTFTVTNRDATAVNEVRLLAGHRIIGEKQNVPPGFSGRFGVNVDAGSYTLMCPGAATPPATLTVKGSNLAAAGGNAPALLRAGTTDYAHYVSMQVGHLVTRAKNLATALRGHDLGTAQALYAKARPFYERIEPVAESFTVGKENLDAVIDARGGDVPASKWTGFHRIEKGLFSDRSPAGLAAYGKGLVRNVIKLQHLTRHLTYQPDKLANGAQSLLDEVATSKITGEEERYSHIDLLDFANNDMGAEQAFADLRPGLAKIDAGLAQTIASRFRDLDALVHHYRTSSNPSGFVYYSQLTRPDKRNLAAAVQAVQEPLSQVASKVSAL